MKRCLRPVLQRCWSALPEDRFSTWPHRRRSGSTSFRKRLVPGNCLDRPIHRALSLAVRWTRGPCAKHCSCWIRAVRKRSPVVNRDETHPCRHTRRNRGQNVIAWKQLGWCEKEGVPRAIFTHCGSEIVEGDAPDVEQQAVALGKRMESMRRLLMIGLN